MSSFKVQVEDLIGSVGDDQLITDSLLSAGAEIIEITPLNRLLKFSNENSISSVNGFDVSNQKVLEVHKDNYKARFVSASDIAKVKDSSSIHYAVAKDPVFYFSGEKIYVLEAGSLVSGKLMSVPTQPTTDGTTLISATSTYTAFFPLEAEKLMIMGASVRCLKRILSDQINTEEDVELARMTLAQLQSLEATYDKEVQKYLA